MRRLWACVCVLAPALFGQRDLTVSGSGCSVSQQAVNSITASNCTIGGSSSVVFEAGGSIHLLPGFRATAGTAAVTFEAMIAAVVVTPAMANPAAGGGSPADTEQTFTFTFSDPLGYGNISSFQVSIGGTDPTQGICSILYIPASGLLRLWDDFGGFPWSGRPGDSSTLHNSQCSIDLSRTQISGSDNILTFTAPIKFFSRFAGQQGIYALAASASNDFAPWSDLGVWNITVPPVPPFTMSVTPVRPWLVAGGTQSAQYQVDVTAAGGFNGDVDFTVSGLPSLPAVAVTPHIRGSGSATLYVSPSATVPPGTYSLTIAATGGGLTLQTAATIQVRDFTISLTPATQSTDCTGSARYYQVQTTSIAGLDGSSGNVQLANASTVIPFSVIVSPSLIVAGQMATVTVQGAYAPGCAAANYDIRISGKIPNGLSTYQTHYAIADLAVNTSTTRYSLTTSANPAAGGGIWPPSGSYAGGESVVVSASANAGYRFTGFSGDLTGSSPQTLLMNGTKYVVANFEPTGGVTISAALSSQTIAPGGSGPFTVSASGGATGTASLTLPPGISGPSMITIPSGGGAAITLTADPSTAQGDYTIPVAGVSDSLAGSSATIILRVLTGAQSFTRREYIRVGGRVIAIENNQ